MSETPDINSLSGRAQFVSAAAEGLTLQGPGGPGKVMWPDGTEITGEQFQNTIEMVATAYAKGRAEALEQAAELVEEDASELWRWHLAEKIRGLKGLGA
jgi:hypothetical protein